MENLIINRIHLKFILGQVWVTLSKAVDFVPFAVKAIWVKNKLENYEGLEEWFSAQEIADADFVEIRFHRVVPPADENQFKLHISVDNKSPFARLILKQAQ